MPVINPTHGTNPPPVSGSSASYAQIAQDLIKVGNGTMTMQQLLQQDGISFNSVITGPGGKPYSLFEVALSNYQSDNINYEAFAKAMQDMTQTPGFDPNFTATPGEASPFTLVMSLVGQEKDPALNQVALDLIAAGANLTDGSSSPIGNGEDAILSATDLALGGNSSILEAMIEKNSACLNVQSSSAPYTALGRAVEVACGTNNLSVVELLLQGGANANSMSAAAPHSVLFYAENTGGSRALCALLQQYGAVAN